MKHRYLAGGPSASTVCLSSVNQLLSLSVYEQVQWYLTLLFIPLCIVAMHRWIKWPLIDHLNHPTGSVWINHQLIFCVTVLVRMVPTHKSWALISEANSLILFPLSCQVCNYSLHAVTSFKQNLWNNWKLRVWSSACTCAVKPPVSTHITVWIMCPWIAGNTLTLTLKQVFVSLWCSCFLLSDHTSPHDQHGHL